MGTTTLFCVLAIGVVSASSADAARTPRVARARTVAATGRARVARRRSASEGGRRGDGAADRLGTGPVEPRGLDPDRRADVFRERAE